MARSETVTCDVCGTTKKPDDTWSCAEVVYQEGRLHLEFYPWNASAAKESDEAGTTYRDLCSVKCMHATLDSFIAELRLASDDGIGPPSPPPGDSESARGRKQPNIEELLVHARNLVKLLEHPEPGLFLWRQMLGETLLEITQFAPSPPPGDPPPPAPLAPAP